MVFLGALPRVGLEVGEGVVHPAHIPLVVKAQAALVCRAGHAGVGGGVLGNEHGRGVALLEPAVQFL